MRISDWSSDVCSSDLGGSLVSLLTLASWGLVNLHVQAAGLDADVFVADRAVRYLAPLFADLRAQARIAEGESWERFVATLRERGRARTTLVATVPLPDGGIATTWRARAAANQAHAGGAGGLIPIP